MLGEICLSEIKEGYTVGPAEAKPVMRELQHLGTEHLYEGLDQKVRPKKRHSNVGGSMHTSQLGSVHATNRMKNNLIGSAPLTLLLLPFKLYTNILCVLVLYRSVLRSRNNSFDAAGLTNESSTDQLPTSGILIDFNRLCDDIYITDWI